MPLQFPLINGVRYSWSSVVVSVGPAQFIGVKSVNFNEKLDPATIHGTGQNILGTTAGMYSADGDIEFYQAESDLLVACLQLSAVPVAGVSKGGWGNVPVTVAVQYIDDQQPTTTKTLTVRLVGRTQGGSEGAESLTSKFTMLFLAPVISDGSTMVPLIQGGNYLVAPVRIT